MNGVAESHLWELVSRDDEYALPASVELLRRRGEPERAAKVAHSKHPRALVEALGYLADARGLPRLRREAHEQVAGQKWRLVPITLAAIIEVGGAPAVDALLELVAHWEPELRVLATRALRKLGRRARNALAELTQHEDVEVRLEAAWGLMLLGESRHVVSLIRERADALVPRLCNLGDVGIRLVCSLGPNDVDIEHAAKLLAEWGYESRALIRQLASTSPIAQLASLNPT